MRWCYQLELANNKNKLKNDKKKRPAPQRWVGGKYQEVYTERETEILTHEWTFKQIEAAKKKKKAKSLHHFQQDTGTPNTVCQHL